MPLVKRHRLHRNWIALGIALLFCLVLASTAAGKSTGVVDNGTDRNSAPSQLDRRVGIVFSETSAGEFHDAKAYSQLFMAMQHQAMMAGIPFELLNEESLIDVSNLVDYDALLFPYFKHVPAALLPEIEAALEEASDQYGIGIITAGDFMTNDEIGDPLPRDPYIRMKQLLAVQPITWGGPVSVTVIAEDVSHPVLRDYAPHEVLFEDGEYWFGVFDGQPGQAVSVLAEQIVQDASGVTMTHNAILATYSGGRNVHFSTDKLMGNSDLVLQALQWTVYGDSTPVALHMGRNKSIFLSRTDMDLATGQPEVAQRLYEDFLVGWKDVYGFVGSFYMWIGLDPPPWEFFAPLYQDYISLGSEIGTHSYTHPADVNLLPPIDLRVEFCDSKAVIEEELDIAVFGAAIPGNPENLTVTGVISDCLGYLSGGYSNVDAGLYRGASGYLTPNYEDTMLYFAPSMKPDFVMIEIEGLTPEEAEAYWQHQYENSVSHASQPLIHWPWHDYGPTTGTDASLYSVEMYLHLIEAAYNDNVEFATAADVHERIKTLMSAVLEVDSDEADIITVEITTTTGVPRFGTFSLEVPMDANAVIQHVQNWYAYDENSIFLPLNGGSFTFQLGDAQDELTHIISLPQRADLAMVDGDGTELEFSFEGEGCVVIYLNESDEGTLVPIGADRWERDEDVLRMCFDSPGIHTGRVLLRYYGWLPLVLKDWR